MIIRHGEVFSWFLGRRYRTHYHLYHRLCGTRTRWADSTLPRRSVLFVSGLASAEAMRERDDDDASKLILRNGHTHSSHPTIGGGGGGYLIAR